MQIVYTICFPNVKQRSESYMQNDLFKSQKTAFKFTLLYKTASFCNIFAFFG